MDVVITMRKKPREKEEEAGDRRGGRIDGTQKKRRKLIGKGNAIYCRWNERKCRR